MLRTDLPASTQSLSSPSQPTSLGPLSTNFAYCRWSATATPCAVQEQGWFIAFVEHLLAVHAGAQEMVTHMESSPVWCYAGNSLILTARWGCGLGGPGFPFSAPLSHGAVGVSLFSSARAGGQDKPLRIIVRVAMSWAVLFSYLRHL